MSDIGIVVDVAINIRRPDDSDQNVLDQQPGFPIWQADASNSPFAIPPPFTLLSAPPYRLMSERSSAQTANEFLRAPRQTDPTFTLVPRAAMTFGPMPVGHPT